MKKPNLIIQMHRLGDLVMCFPLIKKILQLEDDRPLFVVAEPIFYEQLSGLVPSNFFLPPDQHNIDRPDYKAVYNISQREEAARLTTLLRSEEIIGEVYKENELVVEGFWQLYRTSLRQNSRHNLFHWADMHSLDILDYEARKSLPLDNPRIGKRTGKIGLFLGASSPLKRPEAKFYAELAQNLMKRGLEIVLLGGENEKELGFEVSGLLNAPELDMTGKFTLSGLVGYMQELDMLITPDTGPMHLAAAVGVLTLTLSLGNVNPYETSVMQRGHYILQANMSCVSCWECYRNYQCKEKFEANKVAAIAHAIIEQRKILPKVSGLKLFKTDYINGLHTITEVESRLNNSSREKESRYELDIFWRDYFLTIAPEDRTNPRLPHLNVTYYSERLKKNAPHLYKKMASAKLALFTEVEATLQNRTILEPDFWKSQAPIIRIFASFIQVYLENQSYSMPAYMKVFSFFKRLDLR